MFTPFISLHTQLMRLIYVIYIYLWLISNESHARLPVSYAPLTNDISIDIFYKWDYFSFSLSRVMVFINQLE